MAKKTKTCPVVVIPDLVAGRVLLRWYGSRADVLRTLRSRSDDNVICVDVAGLARIEVSFHDSPDAAQRACDRDLARGVFATKPVAGSS